MVLRQTDFVLLLGPVQPKHNPASEFNSATQHRERKLFSFFYFFFFIFFKTGASDVFLNLTC